ALIPGIPPAEPVTRIDEERIALLLRQQIAGQSVVVEIRRTGIEVCRREADPVPGRKRVARRTGNDVAGRGEPRACIGAAAGAPIAARVGTFGGGKPVALVVLERGEETAAV